MRDWKPGDKLLNKYIIEKRLSKGLLSSVYLVQRTINGERLALKVFETPLDSQKKLSSMFFNELKIWMDLPKHPNIARCRFFRTIENRLAVFSDYMEGGTLQDWITNHKLLTVERILDIAIQCAWALQVAHDNGIIHQDIKAENILMSRDGIPLITDFSISSVMHPDRRQQNKNSSQITGLTLAYCSPEQFRGEKVDHRTDIWSYGIVLTYLFTGKLFHGAGYLAREILNYDFKIYNPPYPYVPVSIIQLLDRCFQIDPEKRWSRFSDISDMLIAIFKEEVGRPYHRKKPVVCRRWRGLSERSARMTASGLFWDDPVEWLEKAYKIAGWNLSDIVYLRQSRFFTPRTQALSDIELYEQAEEIFSSAVIDRDAATEELFAELLLNKALVYETLSDWRQAVQCRDRAIKIIERHFFSENVFHLERHLAGAYTKQGWLYCHLGDFKTGMKFYEKAIALRQVLVKQHEDISLRVNLVQTYMEKASALQNSGDFIQAQVNMDAAINMMESMNDRLTAEQNRRLVGFYIKRAQLARDQMDEDNAFRFLSKAGTLMGQVSFEKTDKAQFIYPIKLDYCRAVVEIAFGNMKKAHNILYRLRKKLEEAVYEKGLIEYRIELVRIYQETVAALKKEKNIRDAGLYLNETIRLMEEIVYDEGREEQGSFLAKLYLDKADILRDLGNRSAAFEVIDKSIRLYRWLIEENGQEGLRREWVKAQMAQAEFFRRKSDYHSVISIYHDVVKTLHMFVYQKNQKELMSELAKAKCFLAEAQLMTGFLQDARKTAGECFKLMESVLPRTGSVELQKMYFWAKQRFQAIIS